MVLLMQLLIFVTSSNRAARAPYSCGWQWKKSCVLGTKLKDMQKSKRPQTFRDLDQSISLHRIPRKWWSLLLIFYTPIGLLLALWRIFLSLQALLLLLVIPDGTAKRWMLRVYFGVLGIVVTTIGQSKHPKIFIANRRSYIDHIVLHLATQCTTVSYDMKKPLLAPLFPHHVFHGTSDGCIELESKLLPEFDDDRTVKITQYIPYAIQPEIYPSNGSHILLKFRTWPFALESTVQPMALTVFRPLPIEVSTAKSSGWWDLCWILFAPFTYYNVRFLSPVDRLSDESPEQYSQRVNAILSSELGLDESKVSKKDIEDWFASLEPPPPPKPVIPVGPIIPRSEFDPAELTSSKASPEVEVMVQQVTAVLPQVPHNIIRKDLLVTKSVDMTITNFLEGRVKYTPIPNLYATSTASLRKRTTKTGANSAGSRTKKQTSASGGGLFGSKGSTSSHTSAKQRQLSLEEKKKLLIENARKQYIEKHGLTQST